MKSEVDYENNKLTIAEGFIDTLYRLGILSKREMLSVFFDVMDKFFIQYESKALFDEE